jgi:CheY-like chemotaxis protein
MLNIINDIIDISKIEAGQMQICISEKNVNELAESIISFFKPESQSKGIRLSLIKKLPADEAVIKTDFEKLYAIITNLVKNAIKFTHTGSVEVGYSIKGNYLEFFVIDTGIGIREDHKEFIFERFRQGSESLSRNYEGTGLGLSISKAYAKMLDGRIWFESKHGQGSAFYFAIPYNLGVSCVTKEAEVASASAFPRPDNIKGLVILIAEDDEPSQMYLTRIIAPFGRKILKVRTGEDAVEACRNNSDIDLILMDIKMPGIDGYTATKQIRSFNTDVIIIAQTAFGLMGDKEKTLDSGSNDYLPKPVDSYQLLVLIQKYFGNQSSLS